MTGAIRDADELLLPQVKQALASIDLEECDAAAVFLAHSYARQIDADPEMLDHLGPKLAAILEQLGATPMARSKMKKGPGVPSDGRLKSFRAS